jgi:hypothetical protein
VGAVGGFVLPRIRYILYNGVHYNEKSMPQISRTSVLSDDAPVISPGKPKIDG